MRGLLRRPRGERRVRRRPAGAGGGGRRLTRTPDSGRHRRRRQLASPSVISCTAGIDSVVLEDQGREYVAARIQAGMLEQGVVDMLVQAGAGERLLREGLIHHGIELQFDGERHGSR